MGSIDVSILDELKKILAELKAIRAELAGEEA